MLVNIMTNPITVPVDEINLFKGCLFDAITLNSTFTMQWI